MYVAKVDNKVLTENNVIALRIKYEEMFGKDMIPFNYTDFKRNPDGRCAGQVYIDILKEAIATGVPYDKECRWSKVLAWLDGEIDELD